MSDRQGVEIDYCPQCRGVWLDRGELDKLVERSLTAAPAVQAASRHDNGRTRPDFDDSDQHRLDSPHGNRKKSWLGEIFN